MQRILVSNHSELLRHLAARPFRGLDIDLLVASSGDEAVLLAERDRPALAIIEAELPGLSGYDVARRITTSVPACKVVLVMGKRITAAQMQRVAESGCAEVLIAP